MAKRSVLHKITRPGRVYPLNLISGLCRFYRLQLRIINFHHCRSHIFRITFAQKRFFLFILVFQITKKKNRKKKLEMSQIETKIIITHTFANTNFSFKTKHQINEINSINSFISVEVLIVEIFAKI